MNNILDENGRVNSCTGCGMCSAVCPVDAIEIKLNADGFYRPVVNETKCISCGICKKSCYCYEDRYDSEEPKFTPVCYSAKNKNEEELKQASSGAVSIELMRKCLELGYQVVGVAYDYKTDTAVTKIARTEEELQEFRGSKYFQSNTEEALKRLVKDHSDTKYAFFGTPCQIYAVSKYCDLKNCRDRFLLVDIFCHGCPSIHLWKKYLESQKKQHAVETFDQIRFRSKTYGWHEYCIDFLKGSNEYASEKYNDPFFEMFFDKDIMNEACYACKARSSVSKTDIRIGDFWGWQYDLDVQGVSAVIVNSEKGNELFEQVKDKFTTRTFSLEEVVEAQSYGEKHTYNEDRRAYLLERLSSEEEIHSIQKKYRTMFSKGKNIKRILKNFVKRYGGKYYLILRQKNHKNGNA